MIIEINNYCKEIRHSARMTCMKMFAMESNLIASLLSSPSEAITSFEPCMILVLFFSFSLIHKKN